MVCPRIFLELPFTFLTRTSLFVLYIPTRTRMHIIQNHMVIGSRRRPPVLRRAKFALACSSTMPLHLPRRHRHPLRLAATTMTQTQKALWCCRVEPPTVPPGQERTIWRGPRTWYNLLLEFKYCGIRMTHETMERDQT